MENEITVLIPQYYKKFKCIGSKCEENCCKGWSIFIDKKTYKKYNNIKHEKLRQTIRKNIKKYENSKSNDNYGIIVLNSNLDCPFLDEEGLCFIQKQLGADYLSNVCSSYPRITNRVNTNIERSLALSCPEAARLILLNTSIMEFDEVTEPLHQMFMIHKEVNQMSTDTTNGIEKYFWELRMFTIDILQNRKYSICDRLVILGLFFDKIKKCIEENGGEYIPEIINSYEKLILKGAFKDIIEKIPTNHTDVQLEFMKKVFDRRLSAGINSGIYKQVINEFLQGLGCSDDKINESVVNKYRDGYEKYYKPYIKEKEYILENYYVNYVFRTLFPLNRAEVFDSYMMMIINYALIKMQLTGIAEYNKKIDDEMFIKILFSFDRSIEHNPNYLNDIYNILKDSGYNYIAYMAILIKN